MGSAFEAITARRRGLHQAVARPASAGDRREPPQAHQDPDWEQEATAAGVAHALSLLLDEAGWDVIWRTGTSTRSKPVRRLHGLGPHEDLLGWLYVVPTGPLKF